MPKLSTVQPSERRSASDDWHAGWSLADAHAVPALATFCGGCVVSSYWYSSRSAMKSILPAPGAGVTPSSIADGLSAPFAGRIATGTCKDLERVLVSEAEIEHAFRFLYERAKLACEPAGAVAAAAWLAGKIDAANPAVLVSGGNVAGQTAAAILARP